MGITLPRPWLCMLQGIKVLEKILMLKSILNSNIFKNFFKNGVYRSMQRHGLGSTIHIKDHTWVGKKFKKWSWPDRESNRGPPAYLLETLLSSTLFLTDFFSVFCVQRNRRYLNRTLVSEVEWISFSINFGKKQILRRFFKTFHLFKFLAGKFVAYGFSPRASARFSAALRF